MELKEIKTGMVIHCKNDMEYEQLNAEVIKLGYRRLPFERRNLLGQVNNVVFCIGTDEICWNYVGDYNGEYIEFSDLILPELSAEELLQIVKEICEDSHCDDMCLLHDEHGCIMKDSNFRPDKVLKACEQWKADHEKKEPEVEWADICRIIQIEESGVKKCVHEQTMKNCENAEDEAANILKWYVAENNGNFIAVVEHVCRVRQ